MPRAPSARRRAGGAGAPMGGGQLAGPTSSVAARAHQLEEVRGGPGLRDPDSPYERVQFGGELAAPGRQIGTTVDQSPVVGQANGPVDVRARHRVGAVDAVLQQELL